MKQYSGSQNAEQLLSFRRFLNCFRPLHLTKKPKTLLEITRFPHSELALSNILAFFLNPNEEHGLGDTFLKSLLKAANHPLSSELLREVEVIREDRTDSNKSIDIVIVGASFIVAIEHKIYAEPYNPFGDYRKRLTHLAKDKGIRGENIVAILLCLRPEARNDLSGFKPIVYKSFLEELERLMRRVKVPKSGLGLCYANEFGTTIKNLTQGTHMDPQFIDLVKQNQKTAVRLFLEFENLMKDLKERRDDFIESIDLPKSRHWRKMTRWDAQNGAQGEFFSNTAAHVDVATGLELSLDANVYLKGWDVEVWAKPETHKQARKWLDSLGREIGERLYTKFSHREGVAKVQAAFQKRVNAVEELLKRARNAQH